MTSLTANRSYPYPDPVDAVNPPQDIQDLAEAVDTDVQAVLAGWVSYTPTFSASSGSPSVGTGGVRAGRYKKIGRTVHLSLYVLFGTSPNFGTGGLFLSAPFAAATVTDMAWNGAGIFRDLSAGGSGHFTGYCRIDSAASVVSMYQGTAQVSGTSPFTWAAGDFARLSLTYESAS